MSDGAMLFLCQVAVWGPLFRHGGAHGCFFCCFCCQWQANTSKARGSGVGWGIMVNKCINYCCSKRTIALFVVNTCWLAALSRGTCSETADGEIILRSKGNLSRIESRFWELL